MYPEEIALWKKALSSITERHGLRQSKLSIDWSSIDKFYEIYTECSELNGDNGIMNQSYLISHIKDYGFCLIEMEEYISHDWRANSFHTTLFDYPLREELLPLLEKKHYHRAYKILFNEALHLSLSDKHISQKKCKI